MHTTIHKLLCYSLALVFLDTTTILKAQSTASTITTLTPPQIAAAQTIFVSNGGGATYFNIFTGGPDRGYTQLLNDLERWNRFRIIQSPSAADLIFEIKAIAPASASPGNDVPGGYDPQLVLHIRDPKTNAILWTTTANVVSAGFRKSRDKGFDQSVAVLVDHLRQLTGEQLTSDQTKALRSNASPHSTAGTILFVSGIATVAIMTVVGIHLVHSHEHQTLTPPPLPACTSPFCPI